MTYDVLISGNVIKNLLGEESTSNAIRSNKINACDWIISNNIINCDNARWQEGIYFAGRRCTIANNIIKKVYTGIHVNSDSLVFNNVIYNSNKPIVFDGNNNITIKNIIV